MGCRVDQKVQSDLQATQVVPIVGGMVLKSSPQLLADNLAVYHSLLVQVKKAEVFSFKRKKVLLEKKNG